MASGNDVAESAWQFDEPRRESSPGGWKRGSSSLGRSQGDRSRDLPTRTRPRRTSGTRRCSSPPRASRVSAEAAGLVGVAAAAAAWQHRITPAPSVAMASVEGGLVLLPVESEAVEEAVESEAREEAVEVEAGAEAGRRRGGGALEPDPPRAVAHRNAQTPTTTSA